MSARAYLGAVSPLIDSLGDEPVYSTIARAGEAVAGTLRGGGKVWIAQTTHCLHIEATYRAGGLMAVHPLEDVVLVQPGDCVIEGSPVGTSGLAIDVALGVKARNATLIALTNVAFENDRRTVLEHPTRKRLHEIADIVVDLGGPIGDGVFTDPSTQIAILPHSGVTGMIAMWMIFSEAVTRLETTGDTPRFWECIMVEGATERNRLEREAYLTSDSGLSHSADQPEARRAE